MHEKQTAAPGLPGKSALDAGMRRDIVQACETIEDCAYQLSLTVNKLGTMGSLASGESDTHNFKSQLDEHMSELDGKIRQILDVVKRIGGDLGGRSHRCGG